jgi:PTS system mannose-specific IIA component
MIGLVLVTHGKLASEFIAVLEHIVGAQKQIAAVCIAADDDIEKKRQEILQKATEVDSGKGTLLVTDMFGGTPSDLALSVTKDKTIEALAGLNLPMLIKLSQARQSESLTQTALSGQEAGRKYIHAASALLNVSAPKEAKSS